MVTNKKAKQHLNYCIARTRSLPHVCGLLGGQHVLMVMVLILGPVLAGSVVLPVVGAVVAVVIAVAASVIAVPALELVRRRLLVVVILVMVVAVASHSLRSLALEAA